MAILQGFPPSNLISTGIRFPRCAVCDQIKQWDEVYTLYADWNAIHVCKNSQCMVTARELYPNYYRFDDSATQKIDFKKEGF